MTREDDAYETEQIMLPFSEKDCIFCRGKKCDACSQTGKLDRIFSKEQYDQRVKAKRADLLHRTDDDSF